MRATHWRKVSKTRTKKLARAHLLVLECQQEKTFRAGPQFRQPNGPRSERDVPEEADRVGANVGLLRSGGFSSRSAREVRSFPFHSGCWAQQRCRHSVDQRSVLHVG